MLTRRARMVPTKRSNLQERELGCTEAWVLTDEANVAARALYQSAGGTETAHLMVSFPLAGDGDPQRGKT
jgi:hypothetical protein